MPPARAKQAPSPAPSPEQDTVILADVTFVKLLENLEPKCPSVREVIFLTDERWAKGPVGVRGA